MATSIKKIMGIERNSVKKLNKLQLSEELFCNPLFSDANLKAYYRFEGNSNDSKNSNNGSDTAITYGTSYGKFNKGASLNGSTSKIGIPVNISSFTSISVSFWFKSSSTSNAYKALIGDQSGDIFYIGSRNTNGSQIEVNFKSETASVKIVSGTFFNGSWHHFVVTFTENSLFKIYCDNSLLSSTTPSVLSNTTSMYVGSTARNEYFPCNIDDLAIFNRVLTATEVASLYNSQIKKFSGVSNI